MSDDRKTFPWRLLIYVLAGFGLLYGLSGGIFDFDFIERLFTLAEEIKF